jgi:hypothetical protein
MKLEFKVRKNENGFFIGSDDDGSHRVTPYLETSPNVGFFTLLEAPLRYPHKLAKLFETGFFEFPESIHIEDNIKTHGDYLCYVVQLTKEEQTIETKEEQTIGE